jgi:hypothetical protein
MACSMYVPLENDDKIAAFTVDAGTGTLTPKSEMPVPGGPSLGDQPGPDRTVRRSSRQCRHIQLPDRPGHWRAESEWQGLAGGRPHLSVH